MTLVNGLPVVQTILTHQHCRRRETTRIWKQLVRCELQLLAASCLKAILISLIAAILPTAITRAEPSTPQTPGGPSTITNYAPITIRIDYIVESPSAGVIFVEPDADVAPYVSTLKRVLL